MTLIVSVFLIYFGFILYRMHRRALARRMLGRKPVIYSLYSRD